MKNTIKEDDKRNIIHIDYLNDNCKLECVYDNDTQKVVITIRYVDGYNKIRETPLLVLSMDEYIADFCDLLKINREKDSIAIFEKRNENYVLRDIYDTKEHSVVFEEIKDIIFKKKFPQEELGKNLELIKKPNSGGKING